MKPEELKRLQAAKKQREKEKKDAETNARRHAANVRVRQRAQVHIQGMTTKIANEDVRGTAHYVIFIVGTNDALLFLCPCRPLPT